MNRYWPLTAVLLAFWLGRETAAEKDKSSVAVFDTIEAQSITLTKGKIRTTVAASGIEMTKPNYSAEIRADGTALRRFRSGKERSLAGVSASGFRVLGRRNKNATHVMCDGVSSTVSGKHRFLLGATVTGSQFRLVGADQKSSVEMSAGLKKVSGITVRDAKGKVLAQLPR